MEDHRDLDTKNHGPVTKLAYRRAEEEIKAKEVARIESFEQEREAVKATAALVGEAAMALYKTSTNASMGSSFASEGAKGASATALEAIATSTIHASSPQDSTKKMSVAARARAAADAPMQQRSMSSSRNSNSSLQGNVGLSGNAGVARGKFSVSQVKQVLDAWGKDDTSDDDTNTNADNSIGSSLENYPTSGNESGEWNLSPSEHARRYYNNSSSKKSPSFNRSHQSVDDYFYSQHRRSMSSQSSHSKHRNDGTHGRSYSVDGGSVNSSMHNNKNGNDDNKQDSNEDGGGGGIFQSAKNWLQSQREKLARMELERQVEDQRRKLLEEARKQRALDAELRRRGENGQGRYSASNSMDFGSNRGSMQNNSAHVNSTGENKLVITGNNYLCGLGGSGSFDDSSEYSGMARVDSSGRIIDIVSNESFSDNDEGDFVVSSPQKTVSGKGMSVNVDIPDDDVDNIHYNNSPNHEEDDMMFINDVKIVPEPPQEEGSVTPPILTPSQMKALVASGGLPPSLNYCKWKRLYSLARDGDSFDTFLHLVEGQSRTVLVVKTTLGHLFGGYADSKWEAKHSQRLASEFYGSAQACLFRFPGCREGIISDDLVIYKWSGANRYIQLCDLGKRTIAFGGGGDEGVFGLCIEDDFKRGTTGHCATFENDALCEEGYFDVIDLEIWGFTLDF